MEVVSLLTEEQAATAAGVCERTIRRLIEMGVLPAANYGTGRKKLYRIHPSALSNVQPVQPPPPRERRRRKAAVVTAKPVKVWPPPAAA